MKKPIKKDKRYIIAFIFSMIVSASYNFYSWIEYTEETNPAHVESTFVRSGYRYKTSDGKVSFDVPSRFNVLTGFPSMFTNGIVALGIENYEPLGDIKTKYQELSTETVEHQHLRSITDYEDLMQVTIGDITGQYADVRWFDGTHEWNLRAIFIPSRDIYLSLIVYSKDIELMEFGINYITETLDFELSDTTDDKLIGKSFVSGNDGSFMTLETDGSYCYYQSADDLLDNYYKGTYEVYFGNEAIKEMSLLTNYGLNEQKLLEYIEQQEDLGYIVGLSDPSYLTSVLEFDDEGNIVGVRPDVPRETVTRDDFCILITYPEVVMVGGETSEAISKLNPYMGYYLEGKKGMELTNCNNLTTTFWEIKTSD